MVRTSKKILVFLATICMAGMCDGGDVGGGDGGNATTGDFGNIGAIASGMGISGGEATPGPEGGYGLGGGVPQGGDVGDSGSFAGAPPTGGGKGNDPMGDSSGGWYGSLTQAQQAMTQSVALSLASGNIPGAAIGIVGLALSGAGQGDVGMAGVGGPGGANGPGGGPWTLDRYTSNPQVQRKSLTGQQGKSITGQETTGSGDIKKRGRSSTLMTGPLGLVGDRGGMVERKALMQRFLRSQLG